MNTALPTTLSDDLKSILALHDREELVVAEIVQSVGEKGFGLLLCIFSLPSALPIPAPGYSTPFGMVLLFLAIELLIGKKTPGLPQFFSQKTIKRSLIAGALEKSAKFFQLFEKIIRPRCIFVMQFGFIRLSGILAAIMAIIMIIPIPLTNTLPAMIIFLIGVGLMEKDGLILSCSLIASVVAGLFYGFFAYLIYKHGLDAIDIVRGVLKDLWLQVFGA